MATTTARPTPTGLRNRFMALFLRTPGVQRILGRSVAMITFEGRHSGRMYATPVSYRRIGDDVVIMSWASRQWWRNLEEGAIVGLRLAGDEFEGIASAKVADEHDLRAIGDYLEGRRMDARAYGVALGADGRPDTDGLRALLDDLVVIRISGLRQASQMWTGIPM